MKRIFPALEQAHAGHVRRLFLLALLIKLAIPLCAFLFCATGITTTDIACMGRPDYTLDSILGVYFNSDSGWYAKIIQYGYSGVPDAIRAEYQIPNQHYAFFPLYPMAVRMLVLGGLSLNVAAFLLNMVTLYLLIRVGFLLMLQCGLNALQAKRSLQLLLLFPFSLHLYFVYTESVFLLLLFSGFLMIARGHWLGFSVSAVLIVWCRPNGLLCALPFGLYMLEQHAGYSVKGLASAFRRPAFYTLLLMPAAFLFWMWMQGQLSGDVLAFSKAQAGWNKKGMLPLLALFRTGFWQDQLVSVYCICAIILAAFSFRKWPMSFNVLVWLNLMLPLSAGSVVSMGRYIAVLFPFYMRLQSFVDKRRHFRWLLVLLVLLQILCLNLWLRADSLMY